MIIIIEPKGLFERANLFGTTSRKKSLFDNEIVETPPIRALRPAGTVQKASENAKRKRRNTYILYCPSARRLSVKDLMTSFHSSSRSWTCSLIEFRTSSRRSIEQRIDKKNLYHIRRRCVLRGNVAQHAHTYKG